jgi:2-isopropylmalate synthase
MAAVDSRGPFAELPPTVDDPRGLIFQWNEVGIDNKPLDVKLNDETLRDGLQSPSIHDPTIEQKIELLHLMEALGIYSADLGLPGAGPRAVEHVEALCREIARERFKIIPNCAARTLKSDIEPVAEIMQRTGVPVEAACFIGSSPIRWFAEGWDLDWLLRITEEAVTYAVGLGLPVMYVTEDTTRARPEILKKLYTTAIECGARRICVSDTVGYATPNGTTQLVRFIANVVRETGEDVGIDWHGHRDRGVDIANAIVAVRAGADRIHGTALGVGERVGNMSLDTYMINLSLLGWRRHDLSRLGEFCRKVSEYLKVPIPENYPGLGRDAFRTATGVHASAIIKAYDKGDHWLADRVYSSVPASELGLKQRIEIGPMSGKSNVRFWLKERSVEPTEPMVDEILEEAKKESRLLEEERIMQIVQRHAAV